MNKDTNNINELEAAEAMKEILQEDSERTVENPRLASGMQMSHLTPLLRYFEESRRRRYDNQSKNIRRHQEKTWAKRKMRRAMASKSRAINAR